MEIIDVNRKILSEKKEIEISNEFIVPDTKPDIVNIISSDGITYVHKQEQTDGIYKLEGNVDVLVIYLSSDVSTRSIGVTLDFTSKLENSGIKESSFIKYNIQIENINVKMLNERKISVNVKLSIKYDVYEKQEITFYNDFDHIEDLQKKEEEITLNSVIGTNTAHSSLKEEINVDDMDIVSEILKYNVKLSNYESKMSYNKILAKADAEITILYLTEDDRIGKAKANFPVMSFIEIANVKEDSICDLDYQMKNILIKIDNQEKHRIDCQIDFEIKAQVFEKKTINVIRDLYSLKCDVLYSEKNIEVDVKQDSTREIVKIDEKVELPNVKSVLDVEEKIVKLNKNDSEMELKIYYETNEKNGISVKKISVPFITKLDSDGGVTQNVLRKEYSVEGENAVVQIDLELLTNTSSDLKIPIIEDVQVSECQDKNDYSVVVYFVKPGDTIWKIAKKFKVTMESIIKINNLENPDTIYPGDKIYVLK